MKAPWKSHNDNKSLDAAKETHLPNSVHAILNKRKGPMMNASHFRNAIARFEQVKGITEHEREQAFATIKAAAKHYGIEITEADWHDPGKKPHTSSPSHKKSA